MEVNMYSKKEIAKGQSCKENETNIDNDGRS